MKERAAENADLPSDHTCWPNTTSMMCIDVSYLPISTFKKSMPWNVFGSGTIFLKVLRDWNMSCFTRVHQWGVELQNIIVHLI